MHVEEIEIPVPWGIIAAKIWGKETNLPILVAHGLHDNAGSYDRLIPFLPPTFYYICIDLPGHGKSSYFPPYLPIHTQDFLIAYKLVLDHFNRKKYTILSHSYGAHIGLLFAQLYPEYVSKIIVLDTIYVFPITTNNFKTYITKRYEKLLKINEKVSKGNPPTYTYTEALEKLIASREEGELTEEAAKALLKRALVLTENGKYKFSTDQRLKFVMDPPFDLCYALGLIKIHPLQCPVLFVRASDSVLLLSYFTPLIRELCKKESCVVENLPGSHDVHNVNPEIVGPIVARFLTDGGKSKL